MVLLYRGGDRRGDSEEDHQLLTLPVGRREPAATARPKAATPGDPAAAQLRRPLPCIAPPLRGLVHFLPQAHPVLRLPQTPPSQLVGPLVATQPQQSTTPV